MRKLLEYELCFCPASSWMAEFALDKQGRIKDRIPIRRFGWIW